jgi:hypothetical protein
MSTDRIGAHEALMQFLYRAPIGLVQTTLDGTIEMINPLSASLLMPLSRSGNLDNLFAALEGVAPQLRAMADAFDQQSGVVCGAVRVALAGRRGAPQVLSVSLLKLDRARLMSPAIRVAAAEPSRSCHWQRGNRRPHRQRRVRRGPQQSARPRRCVRDSAAAPRVIEQALRHRIPSITLRPEHGHRASE